MFLLGLPTFYEILLFSQHLNCLAILKAFWKFPVKQPRWIINSPYILRRLSEIIILPGSIIISENRVEIVGVGHSSYFWKCLSSIIFNYYKKMTPLPSNFPPHFIKFESYKGGRKTYFALKANYEIHRHIMNGWKYQNFLVYFSYYSNSPVNYNIKKSKVITSSSIEIKLWCMRRC